MKISKLNYLIVINSILKYVSNLGRGFVLAIILGPSIYGLWKTIQVIISYIGFANLGLSQYIFRELPLISDSSLSKKREELLSFVFTFSLISSGFILIGLFIYYFYTNIEVVLIILICLFFTTQKFYELLNSYLFGMGFYSKVINTETYYSIYNFIIIIIFSYFFKIEGALFAMILSNMLWVYFVLKNAFPDRFRVINIRKIISMSKSIIPVSVKLMIYKISFTIFSSYILIIIGKQMNNTYVGIYGFALTIISLLDIIPNSFNRIIESKINSRVANTNHDSENLKILYYYLREKNIIYNIGYSLFGSFLLSISIFLTRNFLPKYIAIIDFLYLLVLGAIILKTSNVFGSYLISKRKELKLVVNMIIILIFSIFYLFSVKSSYFNYAITTFFSMCLYGYIIRFNFYKTIEATMKGIWKDLIYDFFYYSIIVVFFMIFNIILKKSFGLKYFVFSTIFIMLIAVINLIIYKKYINWFLKKL